MFTEDQLTGLIDLALAKKFPNEPQKRKIYKGNKRLTFSCPFCGDSADPHKKRGNFYTETLSFKCYNGGCGKFIDMLGFLKHFSLNDQVTPDQISDIIELKKARKAFVKSETGIDNFILENYLDVLISRDSLKSRLDLIELPYTAQKYLRDRFQEPDDRFLWEPRKKSMFLLNLTSSGEHVMGLQIKNMYKNATTKYYTYRLSGIYKNLLKERNQEIIEKASELDAISCVFGFSSLDLDSMITIFEGPFDSYLYKNSVGLCSINNKFPFDVTNKRYFLDGDASGKEKAQKLLIDGECIFLWKKFLGENGLPDRKKWDLNDVVIYAKEKGIKIRNLEEYWSTSVWDLIDL